MAMARRCLCFASAVVLLDLFQASCAFTSIPNAAGSNNNNKRGCNHRHLPSPRLSMSSKVVQFQGVSSSSLIVPLPPNASRTLPDFLRSESSDGTLLGTDDFMRREDGLYDCRQPPVGWFGLELSPVFVHRIHRREDEDEDEDVKETNKQVLISIVDARTEISRGERRGGNLVKKLMQKSTFEGRNAVAWNSAPAPHEDAGASAWNLRADLSLTLSVPIPRFAPLPPGFNTIGSQIVRRTCKQRVRENLESVRNAYFDWASTQ